MTRKPGRDGMTAAQRHLAAIAFGAVTKSNVIGIRKAINHVERLRAGWSGNRSNVTPAEADAIEAALADREPAIADTALHNSGLKLLRSPRWRKRFSEEQLAIINDRHVLFSLVRFDRIGPRGMYAVPVYRAASFGGSFLFRNIPWQSASAYGEESGPTIVQD